MRDRTSYRNNLAAFLKSIFVMAVLLYGIAASRPRPVADPKPTTAPPPPRLPQHWRARSTGSIAGRSSSPMSMPTRKVVSIKDPSPVFYEGRWHIYATYAKGGG